MVFTSRGVCVWGCQLVSVSVKLLVHTFCFALSNTKMDQVHMWYADAF